MDLSFKAYSPALGDTFFVTVRNKFVKGPPASLKSSMIALLCSPDLAVRRAVTGLGGLNAVQAIGSREAGAKRWLSAAKGKTGRDHNGQLSQSSNPNSLTLAGLCH